MDRAQTSKKHHYWKKVKVLQELLQRDFFSKIWAHTNQYHWYLRY